MEEAVALIKRTPLSVLGLSGNSIDEYIILPPGGGPYFWRISLAFLLTFIRLKNHQFEQSYLLAVPSMQIYRLDRESGEAVALN